MSIEQKTINTLRVLSVEAIQEANSGHPGLPMGAAPMAYTLWSKIMNHNPRNPNWINRDRFILSAGHGSALLYSLFHLFEYGTTIEDLKDFRQLGSATPGHPEYGDTVGVEATTGPLGQGVANAVGMAMGEAHLAEIFNKEDIEIIDNYTYVMTGDGCLMEGISYEAASLAGTLGLDKLILLYDSNSITIEGGTDLAFTENVGDRFEALNWHVQKIEDGNDIKSIEEAIEKAKETKGKPSMIEIITEIGYGCPEVQGKCSAHGAPLGEENIEVMKENLQWTEKGTFVVPEDVKSHMDKIIRESEAKEDDWNKKLAEYKENYPEDAEKLENWIENKLPMDFLESDEFWEFDGDYSTRDSSGQMINRISKEISHFIGGSADLAPSNKTYMNDREDFSKENYSGSNIRFGVREHAMAAIGNGLALYGGLRPFVGTFFVFSDYMKPAMRLSALMGIPTTYVLTHDSIGVGEDGPTHQPIEHLSMIRSIPNFIDFRPADARETAAGWYTALTRDNNPIGLVLTRQGVPNLEGTGKDALKGGYILKRESKDLDTILISSGSEVHLAYKAAEELEAKGIGTRVVSMPSFMLFEEQSDEYKQEVLPKEIRKRVAIEAGRDLGWYKYIGLDGKIISMDSFGASGPGDELFNHFGFTVEKLIETALSL